MPRQIDDDAEDEGKPSGGKKKLIIIGAAVVVLLIGGGGAAYFFLGHDKAPEEAPVAAEPEIPIEANPVLVSVPRITAPMTKDGAVSGYVYLDLNIEVSDEQLEQTVKDNMPKLRAAFATDLYGQSIVDPKAPDRADVPAIQARLLEVAKHVFGDEAIKKIYVSKVTYVGG
jgi:flagellar FliL protein